MKSNSNIEIERKFLVDDNLFLKIKENCHSFRIQQGYLFDDPEKVVRIRVTDLFGYITIKGKGSISRKEYEYKIPIKDAIELLEFCQEKISKTRYRYVSTSDLKHVWEIDVFDGDNDGLIIAEIELNDENESFHKPKFITEEVTGIDKYYNCNLVKNPYKNW